MEFLKLAKQRFSVRAFKNQPIEAEKLNKILEAGRLAPTAKNEQPQKIFVVQSPKALERLKKYTECHYEAPCILIVCYDEEISWYRDRPERAAIDPTIVLTHMMLQATELGIGSVWVGSCDCPGLIKEFNFPANIKPVALMPLGYASDECEPSPRHDIRRPLEETVEFL